MWARLTADIFFVKCCLFIIDGFAIEEPEIEYDEEFDVITCATIPESCEHEERSRCSVIQKCDKGYDRCFIAWQSVNGSEDILKHQGCWTASQNTKCSTAECKQDPSIENLNFCCCNADRCNTNYTVVVGTPSVVVGTPSPIEGKVKVIMINQGLQFAIFFLDWRFFLHLDFLV
jgi:hypothetical protein